MGTLFSQKRRIKSPENNDGNENQQKNGLQIGACIAIGLAVKIYLQILFVIGAYLGRSWVDKHIEMCYNSLDKYNIYYDARW